MIFKRWLNPHPRYVRAAPPAARRPNWRTLLILILLATITSGGSFTCSVHSGDHDHNHSHGH
jgi:hypothetical protein